MKNMTELAVVSLMLASVSSVATALTIENDTRLKVNVSLDCGSFKDSFELSSNFVSDCLPCQSAVTCDYGILLPSHVGCSGTVGGGGGVKVTYVGDNLSCVTTQAQKK